MHDVPDTPTNLVAYQAVTTLLRLSATAPGPVRNDLFHQQVPDRVIADVFAVMSIAGQHTFQVDASSQVLADASHPPADATTAAQHPERAIGEAHDTLPGPVEVPNPDDAGCETGAWCI